MYLLKMKNTLPLIYICLLVITTSCEKATQPNIVLIMADDLGYGDISLNGCTEIYTPNIDGLADEGTQFTSYYTSGPVCTPTRTALITGRYQARFENMEGAFHVGIDHIGLKKDEETIGKALQRAGYSTGMAGKWHIGALEHMQPQNQGFDEFFGFLGGNVDYFRHCDLDGKPDLFDNGKPVTDGLYMTDLITQKSVEFIQKQKDNPYFLYVAYNAPHWPYQGPDDQDLDVGTVQKWIRNGDRTNLKNMIERMDQGVGDILKCIEGTGDLDNTIVIFCSDNGGDRLADNKPFRGSKGHLLEGGIRSPLIIAGTSDIEKGKLTNVPCITMDITNTILSLANADINVALDGYNLLDEDQGWHIRALCWRNDWHKEYAVRKGKWKLFHEKGTSFLYDIETDKSEVNDLKEKHPEVLKELEEEYVKWEREMPYKQTRFGKQLHEVRN